MTNILRQYDPPWYSAMRGLPPECDEHGKPLDWDRCRTCGGDGLTTDRYFAEPCDRCGGHGSLKEAALAAMSSFTDTHRPDGTPCCEDCGHPMSEGTWEGFGVYDAPYRSMAEVLADVRQSLSQGVEPEWHGPGPAPVHYSPCDEGCRHGGPGHVLVDDSPVDQWQEYTNISLPDALRAPGVKRIEASWRPVDVRTLGWPHDLRSERLAVLCLRCYAKRKENNNDV